jgi:hypothetical protein
MITLWTSLTVMVMLKSHEEEDKAAVLVVKSRLRK